MESGSLVSIIVPVYNTENYLGSCIESLLSQTYTSLQIILVDDGSTDGCGEICDAYARKDPRIQVIHQANGGVSSARNAGLDAARGRYVCFVDSDDHVLGTMAEEMVSAAEASACDLCVGGTFRMKTMKQIRSAYPFRSRLSFDSPSTGNGAGFYAGGFCAPDLAGLPAVSLPRLSSFSGTLRTGSGYWLRRG